MEQITRRRHYETSLGIHPRPALIGVYCDGRTGAWRRYEIGEWRERHHPLAPPGSDEALVYLRLGGQGHNQFYLEDRGPYHVATFFRAYCERLGRHELLRVLARECLAARSLVCRWLDGEQFPREGIRPAIAIILARLSDEDPNVVEDRLEEAYLKDIGRGTSSGGQLRTLLQTHSISSKTLAEAAGFSYRLLYHWIAGLRFPSPMLRLSVVWALAHRLRRPPETIWDEVHRDGSRPRPLPITLGPDVPFPLPLPVIALLDRIESTRITRG